MDKAFRREAVRLAADRMTHTDLVDALADLEQRLFTREEELDRCRDVLSETDIHTNRAAYRRGFEAGWKAHVGRGGGGKADVHRGAQGGRAPGGGVSDRLYWIMLPERKRAGPGHRSHLSTDGETTLCGVENNCRVRRWATFGWRQLSREGRPTFPLPLHEITSLDLGVREMCTNCKKLAGGHR